MRPIVIRALASCVAATAVATSPADAQTLLDKLLTKVIRPKPVASQTTAGAPVGAASTPGARHRPVTEFDVAGIRLRSSPGEVRTALSRSGYRVTYEGSGRSFEQDVASEAARRRGVTLPWKANEGVSTLHATGPHQEALIIEFMAAPSGSEVSDVYLEVPAGAIETAAFRMQLLEKYGRPDVTRQGGAEMSWCSPETVANCGMAIAVSGPLENQYPLLTASAYEGGGGGGHVRLQIGQTAFPKRDAEKEAAIQRLAPKTDRAAF